MEAHQTKPERAKKDPLETLIKELVIAEETHVGSKNTKVLYGTLRGIGRTHAEFSNCGHLYYKGTQIESMSIFDLVSRNLQYKYLSDSQVQGTYVRDPVLSIAVDRCQAMCRYFVLLSSLQRIFPMTKGKRMEYFALTDDQSKDAFKIIEVL